jgi:pyruvate dehydrogenase E2 component (dihydrolipoamide acetyltransferase)
MITRVVMPKLTDTMEEGVVVAWKKHEGEPVDSGDILAEIETDKAVLDLEAFGSGILRKVLVPEGESVKAGKLIAVIGEQDENIEATLADTPEPQPGSQQGERDAHKAETGSATGAVKKETAHPSPPPARTEKAGGAKKEPAESKSEAPSEPRIKASPRARVLAKEQGIDLTHVKGSGPEGRIIESDIQDQAQKGKTRERASTDMPLSQMRKAIARVTTSSKAPVPHFYLTTEIGMDQAERLRKQMEELVNTPLSLTVLFVRAAAIALSRHPEINVSYTGEALRRHASIDIGLAVALEEGLITPVIRDCAGKSIRQLAGEIRDLIVRTKSQQLNPDEYAGATFSISNLGMYEVDNFIAVLMPPQAASLAIGAVRIIPVLRGKGISRSRRMKVTLSCDHRALDGAQGARFLQSFKRVLEKPLELFLPLKE